VAVAPVAAVRITHTLRTLDEQAHLYMQGRTMPGRIVTYAKPGSSAHNYGMAFDFCFAGKTLEECYPKDPARWDRVGLVGESVGLAWGGRWKKLKDRPHFERPEWKAAREALA
jgi:peptidoglycan L-alanyl-D-glutamate endopeptidase CwlK